MTETIEEEALRRVNALGGKWKAHEVDRIGNFDVICALITEHRATKAELEAFRWEISDMAEGFRDGNPHFHSALLHRFIIPKPQPDPLVEAFSDIGTIDPNGAAKDLRAALAARGLEIVKKEPSQ